LSSALLRSCDALAAGVDRVGGKAMGLARLERAGARVPHWAVLGVEVFQTHLRQAGLAEQAAELVCAGIRGEASGAAARALQQAICDYPLDPAVGEALRVFLDSAEPLAVRSSAIGEDGADHSFAGVYTSYLYRQGLDQVAAAVRACWASAFSERALAYRRASGRNDDSIGVGVVVQHMATGDVSGVMFTQNPVTGSADEMLISACWGLGEGVVDGSCNTDEFLVSHDGHEISATIADKDTMVVRAAGQGTQEVAVPPGRRNLRCLTPAQTEELARTGIAVASALGSPQDIEWTFRGDELVLLQTRPITTLRSACLGDWQTVWDNSNIQESFNGVTLPLTFSWASAVYRAIFRETLRLLGVRAKKIRDYDPMLRNMVGLVSGRVYYNINNWYRVLQLAPSFDRKKEDAEKMLGVQNPVEFISDQHLTRREKFRKAQSLLPVAVGWIWRICVRRRSIRKFQHEANAGLRQLRERGENARDLADLLAIAEEALRLFDRWAIPMFNDFFLGIQAGRVRRMIGRSGAANTDEVVAGLLAAHEAIESIEPTLQLMRIALQIQRDERWAATLNDGEPLAALGKLCELAPQIGAQLDAFVEQYGDRCMGEQKLETISLRQDRSFLAKILRNYIADPDLDPVTFEKSQHARQKKFEAQVLAGLPKFRRWRLGRVLASARDAVRSRESMRFTRTRLIGVGRSLYTKVGQLLYDAGCLDDPRQVFYLSMDEISAFAEGRAVTTRLADLARLRAAEFAEYEGEEPQNQFVTFGSPYTGRRSAPAGPRASSDGQVLRGVGCCPGVVEGQTQIVLSPLDDLNVRGKILVTVRTDPGWGPLFPGLAGLLVERGSTLSHSAVLARELGIPAVVGVPGLMSGITGGERVRLDGGTGTVWRLGGAVEQPGDENPLDIAALVRALVQARLDIAEVDDGTPLLDYGMDSVRAAELMTDLEVAFGVEIDDEEAETLVTVRDIVEHIGGVPMIGIADL
jgi:acyl carrier protein